MPYLNPLNHSDDDWQGSFLWKAHGITQNILIPLEVDSNTITGFVVLDDSYFPEEGQSTLFDYAGSSFRESFASLTIHRELDDPALENGYLITLLKLAYSIDHCNELSQNHAIKTAFWARIIAARLGLPQEQQDQIQLASMLHDIGKVVVPKSVLTKPSNLSAQEWMIMRKHPTYGALIMKPASRLHALIPSVKAHHERFDGSGYPLGLPGDQIPVQARIISVADAYATMTEGRIYHPAIDQSEALREVQRCSGKQFDPEIVTLMTEIITSGKYDDSYCHWEPFMNIGVYTQSFLTAPSARAHRVLLFDWGDTLMRVLPTYTGPMATWPRVEAMPYAISTLSRLHPDFTICLATNAADSYESEIRAALVRVNLDKYLDRIFCARSIGYKKPHPAYFSHILEQLNLGPSQVVMIGDDYEADIPGALYAGLHAIWLHPYPSPYPAHPRLQVIPDLSQLPAAVDILF